MPQMSPEEYCRQQANWRRNGYQGDLSQLQEMPLQMTRPPKKHYRGWKWLITILCMLGVWLGINEWQQIHHATSQAFAVKTKRINPAVKARRPISILALGVDVGALNRGNTGGNSDSMELITLNPQKKTLTMTSLPRDTLVRVPTKGGATWVKLNAAYALGGPKQAVESVHELLKVPIDYYAVVNMGALPKVVNTVGGVTVANPFAFDYEGHHFAKGALSLNGALALKYARMRYEDPNNDYGRQARQQQILTAVAQQFKRHASLGRVNQLLTIVGDGVRTNIPQNEIGPFYQAYRQTLRHVNHEHLQGMPAMIDGASMQVVPTKELQRVSDLIHRQLNRPLEPVDNLETRLYDQNVAYQQNPQASFNLPPGAHYNQAVPTDSNN